MLITVYLKQMMIQDSNLQQVISDERSQVIHHVRRILLLIGVILILSLALIKYLTPIDEYIIFMNIKKIEQKEDGLYVHIGSEVFKVKEE